MFWGFNEILNTVTYLYNFKDERSSYLMFDMTFLQTQNLPGFQDISHIRRNHLLQ